MLISLKKFDPARMGVGRVCLFIGKRNTGKSVLMKDVMYHDRDIPAGMVMTGSDNGFFDGWVPDSFVYSGFDKGAVEKLVKRQRRACKQGRATDVFLCLDDCMFEKGLLKLPVMRSLFYNGRHYKVTMLFSSQYAMDVDVGCRTNCDFVFVLRENILANRQRLYNNFFGIFPSFEVFCKVLDATTEDFGCLVLDNTSRSNNIEDCCFWYRAKVRDDFRVGSDMFWRFHRRVYNPRYDDSSDDDDGDDAGKKKKKQVIRVEKRRR